MQRRLPLIALVLVIVFALVLWLRREHEPDGVGVPATTATSTPPPPARGPNDLDSPTESTVSARVVESGAPADNASAPTQNRTGIRVRVLALEDDRPLPGMQVRIRIPEAKQSWADVERSHGTLAEEVRTDADGFAELEMDAGVVCWAHVQSRGNTTDTATVPIDPALANGEVRNLTARVATTPDIDFHGRIVDRTTGAPIAGARIGAMKGWGKIDEASAQRTGADGRFRAQGATWKRSIVNVLADGYELAVVALVSGHATQGDELKIELSRVASVRITVRDASNTRLSDVRVTLSTPEFNFGRPDGMALSGIGSSEGATWSAQTDLNGVAVFDGLPPLMRLHGVVWRGREKRWRTPIPLTLSPAESRDAEWKIDRGCAVYGLVLELDGRAVPSQAVCIEPARGTQSILFSQHRRDGRRVTKSDAEGRFGFEDVAEGEWLVGPAPSKPKYPKEVAPDEPAPFGQRIWITPGMEHVDVELRVQRGITIRGRVLDPTGAPVQSAFLSVQNESAHTQLEEDMNNEQGLFVLGPLVEGAYDIRASSIGSFVESELVRAHSGDTDVVLQLRAGGTIRGVVVDKTTGTPCKASLIVQPRDPSSWESLMRDTTESGSFDFGGLDVGAYSIAAITTNGRVGFVADIEISEANTVDGLLIQVEPGATVRVRYSGTRPSISLVVIAGGARIGSDGAVQGGEASFIVPAGRVLVRAKNYPELETFDLPLTLEVGETRDVVFDGAWK